MVNEFNLKLAHCIWKLIGGDEPKHGFVPDYDSLGENYVGDCGALNGPFEYKVIEWLLIPYRIGFCRNEPAPIQYKTQELSHVIELLNSLGQFELETNENGIKIYGYKPEHLHLVDSHDIRPLVLAASLLHKCHAPFLRANTGVR